MSYGYGYPPQQPQATARYQQAGVMPGSVRLVAAAQSLTGLLVLAYALAVAALMVLGEDVVDEDIVPDVLLAAADDFGPVAPVVLAAVGFGLLAVGRSLRRRSAWGRATVVLICGVGLTLALVATFTADLPATWALAIVVPILCLVLLHSPSARVWFRDVAAAADQPPAAGPPPYRPPPFGPPPYRPPGGHQGYPGGHPGGNRSRARRSPPFSR